MKYTYFIIEKYSNHKSYNSQKSEISLKIFFRYTGDKPAKYDLLERYDFMPLLYTL